MNSSGWPASEGVSGVCEIPSAPWQAAQPSANALPAATSAAAADVAHPASAAALNAKRTIRIFICMPKRQVQTQNQAQKRQVQAGPYAGLDQSNEWTIAPCGAIALDHLA